MHRLLSFLPHVIAVWALASSAFAFAAQPADPLLLVTAPAALQAVEQNGGGIGRWFGASPGTPDEGTLRNDRLAQTAEWRSLTQPLQASVRAIAQRDPQAGVGVARYSHRLFDVRWLQSASAYFELIGVVNRIDRRPFHDRACGETRLVYRLAYRGERMQSRLPMTLAVELRADPPDVDGHCKAAAERWIPPSGLDDAALGRWLVSSAGPLAAERMTRERIAQVTINLQSQRWPSAVRPDLGGHAEYMLRAFRWDPARQRYAPGPLENTPDLPRLRAQPALRAALAQWLRRDENIAALDKGTLRLPEHFLATEAISVAPRGLARQANRPFSQIFGPHEWRAVPGSQTLGSAEAVRRRLDDLTCMGCHQSRAVAGFHLLGADVAGRTRSFAAGNALAVPHSPHLQDELARRAVHASAARTETRPDAFRPLAAGGGPDGAFGAACGLGDPGFASWTCGQGLSCQAHGAVADAGVLGVCMPTRPAVGAICEPTRLTSHADPNRDRALAQPAAGGPAACGAKGLCEATSVGFPGGMCSGGCNPLAPDGRCGRIAILTDFNACLAAERPFGDCLRLHTRPGQLRQCSARQACRDDYICSQNEGQPAGSGVCIPPYFLFQMRVDGHP